jgi:hypothetical protein
VARLGWPVFAALGLALMVSVLPAYALSVLTPGVRAELPLWQLSRGGYAAWMIVENVGPTLVYLSVAAVLVLRASRDLMALFCAYAMVAFGFGAAGAVADVAPASPVGAIGVLLFLVGAGAQVYRYRVISTALARAQTKWVVYGVATCVGLFIATRATAYLLPPSLRATRIGANLIGGGSTDLLLLLVPACLALAVLRAQFWDIDYVVNRTLLYAGLTVTVIASASTLRRRQSPRNAEAILRFGGSRP